MTVAARRRSESRSRTSSPACWARSACWPRCAQALASASTCRCSSRPWRCSSTRRRTPSSPGEPPGGAATPTRTSFPTRRSPRPMARSRSPSAASGSGRACATPWASTTWRQTRASRTTTRACGIVPSCAPCSPTASYRLHRPAGWLPWTQPRCPVGLSTTCSPPSARPRPRFARCRPRSTIQGWGRSARSACPTSCPRRRRRSEPRRRCSASTPTRSWPSSATTQTGGGLCMRGDG